MDLSYQVLKDRQREIRETLPDSLGLRVHRALSWLNRAERERDDQDARFIFLWIAFNAAYANELNDTWDLSERQLQSNFIGRLVEYDVEKLLYKTLWEEFPKSIRVLIDNEYVYEPFWNYHRGNITEDEWRRRFERSKKEAQAALGGMDAAKVLIIVFERLYVLRNQLIHGGATWNSSVNRDQIRDGANILEKLVPIIIHIMLESSDKLWGDPAYPVIAH